MAKDKFGFNKWASTYDKDVFTASPTDDWMFGGYERVLNKVVEYCEPGENGCSSILDIGVGTGNLAMRFLERGIHVTGIDPSEKMRKICRKKYPAIKVMPGDFLKYPGSLPKFDLIISAYAFHHLTAEEKVKAISMMKSLLNPGGRIVIADFIFQNAAVRESIGRSIREKSGVDIYAAFWDEYPGFYDDLIPAFEKDGFKTDGEQLTVSVWIIRACL